MSVPSIEVTLSIDTDPPPGEPNTGGDVAIPVGPPAVPPPAPAPRRNNRIVINVGGFRHETYKSTLKNIPDTRLSWLSETISISSDYDPMLKEYFFDRHPKIFAYILNFYRTGKLHVPNDMCGPLFEEELAFWGIDEKMIEPCCWMNYIQHRDAQETLKQFDGIENSAFEDDDDEADDVANRFGIEEARNDTRSWWEKNQPKIWVTLEEPYSSVLSRIVAGISLVMLILSITVFCLETIKELTAQRDWVDIFTSTNYVCAAYFTIEVVLRFIFCPSKCNFFKSFLNIIDILALIPFYVEFGMSFTSDNDDNVTLVMNMFKVFRVFRIFKLTRHLTGLNILAHTIRASLRELFLLFIFIFLGFIIFSSILYYTESGEPDNDFENIPIGFWWAVVTMTTLGYGEMVPTSVPGRVFGAFCAICGVLTLALPVPVIVNNFALYYSHAQAKMKLPKKKRNHMIGASDALKTHLTAVGSMGGESIDMLDNCKASSSETLKSSKEGGISIVFANGEVTNIKVTFTDETTPAAPPCPPTALTVSTATVSHRVDTQAPTGLGADQAKTDSQSSLRSAKKSPRPARANGRRESSRRESFVPGFSNPGGSPVKRAGPPPRRMSFAPNGNLPSVDI